MKIRRHYWVFVLFIVAIIFIYGCGQESPEAIEKTPEGIIETSPEEAAKEEKASPLQDNFDIVKNEIDYWADKDGKIGHEHYERLAKQLQEFEDSGISKDEVDSYKEKLESIKEERTEKHDLGADKSDLHYRDGAETTGLETPECPEELIKITPVDITKATSILYPGQERGGHYKAHGGFGFENSDPDTITVRVPQDSFVTGGVRYYEMGELQYIFDFWHPCGIGFRFDHIRILSPKFQEIADKLPLPKVDDTRGIQFETPIEVKAGEVIATGIMGKKYAADSLTGFDFGMYDWRQLNEKAASDPDWTASRESDQARHAVCFLDFLPQPDRTIAKGLPEPGGNFDIQSDYC